MKPTRRFASIAACALVVGLAAPAPAHAEGFFEALFGGLKRAVRGAAQAPKAIIGPLEPLGNPMGSGQPQMPQQAEAGRTGPAYCVRGCDGYYFPVRAAPGMSPKQMCGSLCPACETKVFYGGGAIETTIAADGTHYAEMPNAYAYRKQISDACTCNGKSPLGLAKMTAASDPTLRSGDVVVTRNDVMVFNSGRGEERRFTPVKDYPGLTKRFRDSLEQIDVASARDNTDADKAKTDKAMSARAEAPAEGPNAAAQVAPVTQRGSRDLDFHQRWTVESAGPMRSTR